MPPMPIRSNEKVRGLVFSLSSPTPPYEEGMYSPDYQWGDLPAYSIDVKGSYAVAYGERSECTLTGGVWTLMKNVKRFNV